MLDKSMDAITAHTPLSNDNTTTPLHQPLSCCQQRHAVFSGGAWTLPTQVHRPRSPSVARDSAEGGGEFWGDVFGHALGDEAARGVDKGRYSSMSIAMLAGRQGDIWIM